MEEIEKANTQQLRAYIKENGGEVIPGFPKQRYLTQAREIYNERENKNASDGESDSDPLAESKEMAVVPASDLDEGPLDPLADSPERSFRRSSPEPVSRKRSAETSELSPKDPKKIKKDAVPPPVHIKPDADPPEVV